MKNCLLTIGVFFACTANVSIAGDATGTILDYGIVTCDEIADTLNYQPYPDYFPPRFRLRQIPTNTVPAKLWTAFYVRYELQDLEMNDGEIVRTTIVTKHPRMMQPDGKVWRSFSCEEDLPVRNGKAEHRTSWRFMAEHELVDGDWEIQVLLDGKVLASQKFIVVK